MSLRDVTFVVEDGSLGNSGSTGTGVHVKIGASPVETTVPILITGSMKPEQMKEKLGLSPLADACIDSVENGASRIYCVPVRPETAGTNGEVAHSGTGGGTVSVSGTPNNAYDIILKITEDGRPIRQPSAAPSMADTATKRRRPSRSAGRRSLPVPESPLHLRKNSRQGIPTGFQPRPRP